MHMDSPNVYHDIMAGPSSNRQPAHTCASTAARAALERACGRGIQLTTRWESQVLPEGMLLLAEPSPLALAAAVESALDRVGSIDRQSQHEQVRHNPVFCNLQTGCKHLHAFRENASYTWI